MSAIQEKTLYILIGPPGCGKSKVAWELVNKGALRISGDDIFFAITDRTHAHWLGHGVMDAVNESTDKLMDGLLARGLTVIADRTHLSPETRRRPIELARRHGFRVEGMVWLNFDQARERNSLRSGRDRVPESVWVRMVEAYAAPTLEEGFDEIHQVVGSDGV